MLEVVGNSGAKSLNVTQDQYDIIQKALRTGKLVLYDNTEKEVLIVDWVSIDTYQAGGNRQ